METDQNMEFPGNGDAEQEFDTDFDAGVEADEEEDPKKYIQQLTGKLSQSLRKYNSDQAEPDADLNKYVAGMVVKQAVEGLSEKERNEILKKVTDDTEEADSEENGGEEGQEQRQENEPMEQSMGESKIREQIVNELFNDIIAKKDTKSEKKPVKKGGAGYRNRPY